MKAQTQMRNPFHRLTTPLDVANVIFLLSLDEAAWTHAGITELYWETRKPSDELAASMRWNGDPS